MDPLRQTKSRGKGIDWKANAHISARVPPEMLLELDALALARSVPGNMLERADIVREAVALGIAALKAVQS